MRALAGFVASRRGKWIVLAAWLVLLVVFAPLGGKLGDKTNDQTSSFLPKHAESTKVLNLLESEFPGGETDNALIVYKRPGGLTAQDKRKMADDAQRIRVAIPVVGRPVVPFQPGSPRQLVARDGTLAYTVFAVPDRPKELDKWGKKVRDVTGKGTGGLRVYLTGELGFNTDASEIFGSLDSKLLIATVLLVLVLLGAIYRAPIIAFIPLVVVGVAYMVATGLIYLYADTGATVSTNSTSILVVLMFGVGTDYCLLLVSRYREELRRFEDKHRAMGRALHRVGPAIVASGLTVAVSMLVLLVAETGSIHSLGPVAGIGVLCALLAGVTLLPALLTIAGRRGFWPRRRLIAYDPEATIHERAGVWRRIGDRVVRHPGPALAATVALFGAGALGLLAYKEDYSTTGFFKKKTESVTGYKALQAAFPAGVLSPTTVLVQRDNGPVRPADVQAVAARLRAMPHVAAVLTNGGTSRDGRIARLSLVFADDPYKQAAFNRVPQLRRAVSNLGPGVRALLGGGSATQYDFNRASARDLKVIVPIALAVICVILGVLLEAVVAPLVLIGTVIASFFGTLGIGILFIRYVDGQTGIDNSLPTFAFIFLVALGIDYTIFLMSRVREEARRHGTREGTLRALTATGPVITSAGVILAGTFSVLMTLPVTFAFNIGFLVALGILLDTFIVRTIMVPAAVELVGDKIWWPSSPSGGAHVLAETDQALAPPEREPVEA
ncbi:MAG: MMPL family transporter [Thermoleophilaceae bacterium]